METPIPSNQTANCHIHQMLGALGLLSLMGILSSCSTGLNTDSASAAVSFQSSDWNKVGNSPPTYYPKGVPADHPTGFSNGHWVLTEDRFDSRHLIPLHGVATKKLTSEAMTKMTPERQKTWKRAETSQREIPEVVSKRLSSDSGLPCWDLTGTPPKQPEHLRKVERSIMPKSDRKNSGRNEQASSPEQIENLTFPLDLSKEPRARKSPVPLCGRRGNPKGLSGLLNRHSDKVSQLNQLRFARLDPGKPIQQFVN